MTEVTQVGWGRLESLLPDPTAEEVYGFLEKVLRLQSLFRPGGLEVHECVVTPLDGGAEEYHATLVARQITQSGRPSSTENVLVRVTFLRTPASETSNARSRCTHMSIGLVRVGEGVLHGRGIGLDITYSAFDSTTGIGMHRVRIRDFPNGWRRTLRYASLSKILEWQLRQTRLELSRCQNELESARQKLALREDSNS